MAFAQFYYDPAVEFEKLLDDHGGAAGLPVPTPVPQTGDVAAQTTAPVADKVVMPSSAQPSAAAVPQASGGGVAARFPLLMRWSSGGSTRS
ncbi:hypothetical protein OH76DRAFT_1480954 [Lentinus brumalis]|uniref:Uncharacterized protein n=1 Tax=Lentinus brumalis TaxID=2498619 RepID=A0A371DH81_9APHY|nr:hypothetical protein OH76DRAFT_1480954 [Polyporus brumalis]